MSAHVKPFGSTELRLSASLPARFHNLRPLPGRSARDRALADDAEQGGHVVIKTGPEEILRVEAEALRSVSHRGIAALRGTGGAHQAWLAIEYVEGDDLEAWLRRHAPSPDEVRALLHQVAEALAALHAAAWLHRDLKPANLVRRPDGAVVLIDLGAAGRSGLQRGGPDEWSLLTEGYAAPEQYRRGELEGPWTDVYGLAALGWRMLTGTPPLAAPARERRDTHPPLSSQVCNCAADLALAIDHGLALAPAERPRDAAAFATLLALPAEAAPAASSDRELPRSVDVESGQADEGQARPAPETRSGADDDGPPTVPVRRRPAPPIERAQAERAEEERVEPQPPGSAHRRWPAVLATVVAILLVEMAVGVALGWRELRALFKHEWVVDAAGGGDVATIAQALDLARPGARIRIRPGTYAESVVVERDVALVAADPSEPPRIVPPEGPCLVLQANGPTLSGLRLEAPAQGETSSAQPCLDVQAGAPTLTGIEVDTQVGPALRVTDGAAPEITAGAFRAATGPAVLFADGARGRLEGAILAVGIGAALTVRGGAAPDVAHAMIEGGTVLYAEGSGGTFQASTITNAQANAIEISSGARPTIASNRIEAPRAAGVFVYDTGGGRIAGNTVTGAGLSGIVVTSLGRPEILANAVRDSGQHGILVVEGGGGRIAGNQVTGGKGHGIVLGPAVQVELGDNKLDGNVEPELFDGRRS
jgi:parallel beta-helix repeat protein